MRRFLTLSLLLYSCSFQAQNWDLIDPFPGEGRDDASVFVIDNFAYCGSGLATGWITVGDFYRFDLNTETWESIAPLPIGKERQYACGFSLNGKGYLFGGYDGSSFLNDVLEYDPVGNAWTEKTALPGDGRGGMSCFVLGDTAYIVGGKSSTENALNEVWAYDIVADTWVEKNPLLFGQRWRASAVATQTEGYMIGGRNELNESQSDVHVYDPINDSWAALNPFPAASRYYAAAWFYNGQIYYGFGFDDPLEFYKDLWVYSIVSNEWTALGDFPSSARRGGLSFTGPIGLYYTTGVTAALERTAETWRYEPLVNLNELSGVNLLVYPNPATDQVTILANGLEIDKIELVNLAGQTIKTVQSTNTVNTSNLSAGVYLVKMYVADSVVTKQLVIR